MQEANKVFIVEHSSFIRSQITSALEKIGIEVKTSHSASKALLEIVHWHPDVVISSANIDDITGFDLCLLLKMMPEHAGIPFIIMSSDESERIKSQMASVGADLYIHKDSQIAQNAFNAVQGVLQNSKPDSTKATITPARKSKRSGDYILVVDDSAVMRRIICNILASMEITKVIQAQDGKDALKQMQKHDCKMVITDWNMPIMTGLELTKSLRSTPATRNLPIIMITTEGAQAEREEAEKAGVNDLLPKPFTRDHLRQLFEKHL